MSPSLPRILRIPPMTRHAALRAMLAASLALMLGACASHSGVRDDAPPPPVGGTAQAMVAPQDVAARAPAEDSAVTPLPGGELSPEVLVDEARLEEHRPG